MKKAFSTTSHCGRSKRKQHQRKINNQPSHAKTTKQVIETLLNKTNKKYAVTVEHQIEVPIGMGFGTSAGGALTAGLALKEAIELPLTYNQIGQVAHIAEIQCQTGLGTVSSLNFGGGLILVTEPGAPGICQIRPHTHITRLHGRSWLLSNHISPRNQSSPHQKKSRK